MYRRRDCEVMADALFQNGIQASAYHGGMTDTERSEVQTKWVTDDSCKVLVVCVNIK